MAMEATLAPDNPLALSQCLLPSARGERRIMHYSSLQQILLVGEGDFSFSNALATAFGHGRNLIATSLDSHEKVLKKYADAAAVTLANLKKLGALLFHEVDATCMAGHSNFYNLAFDCVVYNFPHAGFHGPEDDKKVIKRHKELVRLFFQNAAKLLRLGGEVHVSHKVSSPYSEWKLEKQAAKSGLVLKEACDFHKGDYPGYLNRRGDGANSGGTFPLGKCKTYIFRINPVPFPRCKELPHFLQRRLQGFYHNILWRRRAVVPPPFKPGREMGPSVVGLSMQNISPMKRQREDGYGAQDWDMLEQQRFSKRGCFGLFLPANIHARHRFIQESDLPPPSGLALRTFPAKSQFWHMHLQRRMPAAQHLRGMIANGRMHTSAGHALQPPFH